jgi:hypothetical protein
MQPEDIYTISVPESRESNQATNKGMHNVPALQ